MTAASRLRSSLRVGRRRVWQPSGVQKQRDANMVEEDVASWPRSSGRVGRRRCRQLSGVPSQRCAQVGSGCRFQIPGSDLHSSLRAGRRPCRQLSGIRSRDAQKQSCAQIASRLRSSVRVGRRRVWQPSGVQRQRCAEGGRDCRLQAPIFSSRGQASMSAAIVGAEAEARGG